jgi:hypothetical protein
MDDAVETPYYRTIPLVSPDNCAEEPSDNYTPYDLFCLNQKLASHLIRLKTTYRPSLVSQEIQGRMVITVSILDGETKVPLTPTDRQNLQTLVNAALSDSPGSCPLISSDLPGYPTAWLQLILQYLSLPAVLNPYIADGILYITIDGTQDYQMIYTTLNRSVMNQIDNLYTAGAIVCDANFARTWRLLPLYRSSGNPWSPGQPTTSSHLTLPGSDITMPSLIGDTVMVPGYEHVLNDWDSTLSTSRTGSGSRRDTERSVAVLGQFFNTQSDQEALTTGIDLITGFQGVSINPSVPSVAADITATGLPASPGVMPTGIPGNEANASLSTVLGRPIVGDDPTLSVSEITEFNALETLDLPASEALTDLERVAQDQRVVVENSTYDTTGTGLYMPPWRDDRFAPDRTLFLLDRLHGHRSLPIPVGLKYVIRHNITRELAAYYRPLFVGANLILPATSYDDIERLMGHVYRGSLQASGRVAILPLADERDFHTLNAAAHHRWPETTTALYDVDNPIKPLIFSWSVPLDLDLDQAQQELLQTIQNLTLTSGST